jgi:hypothetical protein
VPGGIFVAYQLQGYNMNKSIRSLVITALAVAAISSVSSCRKDVIGCTYADAVNYNPQANIDNGSCQYSGRAVFWYDGPRNDAVVTINGRESYITQYYPVALPACGSNGCANFTLAAGTYSYHADTSVEFWDGTMTVNANECSLILLN